MEGIIDLKLIKNLLDSDLSAYRIEDLSGISRMTITKYRNGTSDIMNMTLNNALKLCEVQRDINSSGGVQYSYDYSELLQEFAEEFEDGVLSLSDEVYIIRALEPVYEDSRPVIDWYYLDDLKSATNSDRLRAVKVNVEKLVAELQKHNKIM